MPVAPIPQTNSSPTTVEFHASLPSAAESDTWIIDYAMAIGLALAIDRLQPRPVFLCTLDTLYAERATSPFSGRPHDLLQRLLGTFIEPIDLSSMGSTRLPVDATLVAQQQLYVLDVCRMLEHVDTSFLSWSAWYADVNLYVSSCSLIEQVGRAIPQKRTAPVSVTSSLIDGLHIFDSSQGTSSQMSLCESELEVHSESSVTIVPSSRHAAPTIVNSPRHAASTAAPSPWQAASTVVPSSRHAASTVVPSVRLGGSPGDDTTLVCAATSTREDNGAATQACSIDIGGFLEQAVMQATDSQIRSAWGLMPIDAAMKEAVPQAELPSLPPAPPPPPQMTDSQILRALGMMPFDAAMRESVPQDPLASSPSATPPPPPPPPPPPQEAAKQPEVAKKPVTCPQPRLPPPFPLSTFERSVQSTENDVSAGHMILTKIKLLAIDTDPRAAQQGRRYSLAHEKRALQSMPVNYTLAVRNPGDGQLSIGELLRRAFQRYDKAGAVVPQLCPATHVRLRRTESAERAFLVIAVGLLRHVFMYPPDEPRIIGQSYARDFDDQLPASSMCSGSPLNTLREGCSSGPLRGTALYRRARILCRIVIACGHPCIILVLVRMAVRLATPLSALLDSLPLDHFCRWIANGRVSNSRLQIRHPYQASRTRCDTGERLEADLYWAHQFILLPLLAVAMERVPESYLAFDGRVTCSVDSCTAAILPFKMQARYVAFVNGRMRNDDWQRGRFRIDGGGGTRPPKLDARRDGCASLSSDVPSGDDSDDDLSEQQTPQYTIETCRRTFATYDVPTFRNRPDLFDPAPGFLKNRALTLDFGAD